MHLWVMQRVCLPGHADQIQMTPSELSSCPSPRARVTSFMQRHCAVPQELSSQRSLRDTPVHFRPCREYFEGRRRLDDPQSGATPARHSAQWLSPPSGGYRRRQHFKDVPHAPRADIRYILFYTQKDSFTHRLSEGARMACLDQRRIQDWSAQLPKSRPRNILPADNLSQPPL